MTPEANLRKSLIRTAASLPKGSQERKAVLDLLGAPQQKAAGLPALPKARRNTSSGQRFQRSVYSYMHDYVEHTMSDVPSQKRQEFLQNRNSDMVDIGTQEEVIKWLTSTTGRGFLANWSRWTEQYGDAQAGLKQDAAKLVRGLDNKKIAIAVVAADLTWKWDTDSLYSVSSDIGKGDVSKSDLVKFVVALRWVTKLKLPKL